MANASLLAPHDAPSSASPQHVLVVNGKGMPVAFIHGYSELAEPVDEDGALRLRFLQPALEQGRLQQFAPMAYRARLMQGTRCT